MNDPYIKTELEKLISLEYMNILAEHGSFVDYNQAESVLNAEVEEVRYEFERVRAKASATRHNTFMHDDEGVKDAIGECYNYTVRMIEEAIQVAAVCRKALGMP